MKTLIRQFSLVNQEPNEEIHLVGTIAVVVAMLSFVGSTFYILLNNFS